MQFQHVKSIPHPPKVDRVSNSRDINHSRSTCTPHPCERWLQWKPTSVLISRLITNVLSNIAYPNCLFKPRNASLNPFLITSFDHCDCLLTLRRILDYSRVAWSIRSCLLQYSCDISSLPSPRPRNQCNPLFSLPLVLLPLSFSVEPPLTTRSNNSAKAVRNPGPSSQAQPPA